MRSRFGTLQSRMCGELARGQHCCRGRPTRPGEYVKMPGGRGGGRGGGGQHGVA